MIRERRNKEKLASYYKKFMEEGIVDPNVHPWVAESWQRCRAMGLPNETLSRINKLSRSEIEAHQKTHEFIVKYVDGLYEQSKHPNIKQGDLYVVHFKDCILDGETIDAIGLFKSENKDTTPHSIFIEQRGKKVFDILKRRHKVMSQAPKK